VRRSPGPRRPPEDQPKTLIVYPLAGFFII
jgi:hypothetical protein